MSTLFCFVFLLKKQDCEKKTGKKEKKNPSNREQNESRMRHPQYCHIVLFQGRPCLQLKRSSITQTITMIEMYGVSAQYQGQAVAAIYTPARYPM